MKKRRAAPEYALHVSVAQFLHRALSIEDGVWWTTIGHGAQGNQFRTVQRLRSMGVKAGVPDLLVINQGRALWIELKSKTGDLSDAQKATRADLNLCRGVSGAYVWEQCRSVECVEASLRYWGVPLRATVGYSTAAGAR